jgi:hypothetical protein
MTVAAGRYLSGIPSQIFAKRLELSSPSPVTKRDRGAPAPGTPLIVEIPKGPSTKCQIELPNWPHSTRPLSVYLLAAGTLHAPFFDAAWHVIRRHVALGEPRFGSDEMPYRPVGASDGAAGRQYRQLYPGRLQCTGRRGTLEHVDRRLITGLAGSSLNSFEKHRFRVNEPRPSRARSEIPRRRPRSARWHPGPG